MLLAFLTWLYCLLAWASSAEYPTCWIRRGECLDNNEPPLQVPIKPQINHNIIGNSIESASASACAEHCFDHPECRFFTWYDEPPSEERRPCHLVGFNLKQACFALDQRCVLLRECRHFNESCGVSCHTGIRPLTKPSEEPHTVLLNGRTDNRNYKEEKTEQYKTLEVAELLTENGTCAIPYPTSNENLILQQRIGSVAAFVDDHLLLCGGFSTEDKQYLKRCQLQSGRNPEDYTLYPWQDTGNLNTARAFASIVTIPKKNDSTVYILGGYQNAGGFLDSIEKYDKWNGEFELLSDWKLAEAKSHFCTLLAEIHGIKYLYTIGGWNLAYLRSVHRMQLDDGHGPVGSEWFSAPSLLQERSDHACALAQLGWETGIMVAGGYKSSGAWTNTVEFFNFEKGEWVPFFFSPQLTDGRHYHGLTSLGLIPTVFGGWNNGSLASIEQLDYCSQPERWVEKKDWLLVGREHFAHAQVPPDFYSDCAEGLPEDE